MWLQKFIVYHLIVLLVLLIIIFIYQCPIKYFFHIPCPGCGITRAYLSVLSLDFKSAFQYHPLFFTVVPTILYISHRSVLRIKLSYKIEKIYFGVLMCMFFAVYIIRYYL